MNLQLELIILVLGIAQEKRIDYFVAIFLTISW